MAISPLLRVCAVLLLFFLGLFAAPLSANTGPPTPGAKPIEVRPSFSVRSDDWLPLPEVEMQRAAGDIALARLSGTGRIRLDRAAGENAGGRLSLEIALIGPAETATLTITLDAPGRPTLVSTASISVRGLDHAGIFAALQHVGDEAAERLVTKLELLDTPSSGLAKGNSPDHIDPTRREAFDRAQREKHAGRFDTARRSFEGVVRDAPNEDDALARMAKDELRYGLPVYEARQALNALGRLSLPGQGANRDAALARAEHLYRQIQAENPQSLERVTEAQRALDDLSVVRGALANAMRAQLMSRATGLRMVLMEHMMMEGVCPDLETTRRLASQGMGRGLEVVDVQPPSGDARERRYRLGGGDAGATLELVCDETGVRVGDVGER